MDWDECLEASPTDTTTPTSSHPVDHGPCIVIDTNVLISDLPLVQSLVGRTFDAESARPLLMVPYVVLQELDSHKQRRVQPIAAQSQTAIKYIHECLKSKDARLKGERLVTIGFKNFIIVYSLSLFP